MLLGKTVEDNATVSCSKGGTVASRDSVGVEASCSEADTEVNEIACKYSVHFEVSSSVGAQEADSGRAAGVPKRALRRTISEAEGVSAMLWRVQRPKVELPVLGRR